VAISQAEYRQQLMDLLPPSDVLDKSVDSNLSKLLDAMAEEFARLDSRVDVLISEADPRTATEMLGDWERELALPGDCAPLEPSLMGRRDAVHSKLTERGGQSRQYFIDIAARLGFTITITEFRPFVASSLAGEVISNGTDWMYTWQVNAPAATVRPFVAGSGAGEALASWGNALLQCAISEDKPAHTHVNFAYGG